jgi:ubiquinone biosynthesis protein
MLNTFTRRAGHLRRYREIAHILIRYGFDNVVDQLGLKRLLSLPNRLAGRVRPTEPLSAAKRLRMAIEELGPTFVKLGQALSTRPDVLPPEFLIELARLRDDVPPFPFETVKAIIESELGYPLPQLFQSFDEEPLAAASLGQVHSAVLPDGRQVVVKVLRPDIHAQIELDLDILRDMANLAEERTAVGKQYALADLAEEFAVTLRAEMDYIREAHNVERFQRHFAGRPEVMIPAVYTEYTTHRVLTLQRIHGIKIDDIEALRAAGLDPEVVADQAIDLTLQEIFVDGFFHADPHPGNLYVMEGNVIGVMDFGMVGYLDRHTKEQLLRLFVAIFTRDSDQVVTELIQMEMVGGNVDHRRMSRDVSRFMERFWGLALKDLTFKEIFDGLMPIAFRHRLTLPGNLWLLAKALVMMEGVGQLLNPQLNVFERARPYAADALRELQSPAAWARRAGRGVQDWAELWYAAPQRLPRLLDQLTKGELTLTHRLNDTDRALNRLDRMVNRLVVGLIIAANIVAIALSLPLLASSQTRTSALALIGLVLLSLFFAGVWMLWSFWRSSRR